MIRPLQNGQIVQLFASQNGGFDDLVFFLGPFGDRAIAISPTRRCPHTPITSNYSVMNISTIIYGKL